MTKFETMINRFKNHCELDILVTGKTREFYTFHFNSREEAIAARNNAQEAANRNPSSTTIVSAMLHLYGDDMIYHKID